MSQADPIDIKYGVWTSRVREGIRIETGLDLYDLPDVRLRDYYDDELQPSEAVAAVLDELYDAGELPVDPLFRGKVIAPGVQLHNGATVVDCTEVEFNHGVLIAVRDQRPHQWVVWDYRPGDWRSTAGGEYCHTLDEAITEYRRRGGDA